MMYEVNVLGGKYISVKAGDIAFDDGRFYLADNGNEENEYYINLIVK